LLQQAFLVRATVPSTFPLLLVAGAVGRLTARLLRAGFGAEYDDKVTADTTVLGAGGTVLHSGPLSDKADDPGTRALPLSAASRRFFPHRTPRATIARLMLDEAEAPMHPGQLIIPHPQLRQAAIPQR
jgi:hypothetical protein